MSEAVFEERFIKLVEDNGGFEYYQAYRGDVDLILGGKGLDVSVEYGVTIAYNDIKDADASFHLRYLYIGNDVDLP